MVATRRAPSSRHSQTSTPSSRNGGSTRSPQPSASTTRSSSRGHKKTAKKATAEDEDDDADDVEEEEDDEDAEDEDEEEEEEEEKEEAPKASTRRSTRPRTPKRVHPEATATTAKKSTRGKGRTPLKGKKRVKKEEEEEKEEKEEEDEDEDDGDAEEEEDEPPPSTPAKKRRTGTKTASAVKAESHSDAADAADDGDEDDDDGEEAKTSTGPQKRKRASTTPKAGSGKKRRGKYSLTAPDPSYLTTLDAVPNAYASTSPTLQTSCCSRCSSREVHRAVLIDNPTLLQSALDAHDAVSDPLLKWADQCDDALARAIKLGRVQCARLLWQHMQVRRAMMMRGKYFVGSDGSNGHQQHFGGFGGFGFSQRPAADGKEELPESRVALPTSTLASLDTGESNFHQFGHATRKLNASRGGKEGNNAFLHEPNADRYTHPPHTFTSTLAESATPQLLDLLCNQRSGSDVNYFRTDPPKDAPYVTCREELMQWLREKGVSTAALAGNIAMARHLIHLMTQGGSTTGGFNPLHSLVLDPTSKLPVFRAPSATKKASDNDAITPVHLACLSPDTRHLKRLIEVGGVQVIEVTDRYGRKAVHYAAVSPSSNALQLLLSLGASIADRDKSMKTPLHYAIDAGRDHNIHLLTPAKPKPEPPAAAKEEETPSKAKAKGRGRKQSKGRNGADPDSDEEMKADDTAQQQLMEEAEDVAPTPTGRMSKKERNAAVEASKLSLLVNDPRAFLNAKEKKTGDTLLHHAARAQHAGCVRRLVELGAEADIADKEKLTPMMLLAQRGALEGMQALLESAMEAVEEEEEKTAVEGKLLLQADRTGKSAIHFAVMNGHFDVVKWLLSRGVDVSLTDTSQNTLLHYAVAYGHSPLSRLLIAGGAHKSALNMWKLSPLFIAMLKNHLLCAELILSHSDVDVNQKDAEGRTLLMHAIASKSSSLPLCMKQVDFVLGQAVKADVTARETTHQRTALHLLASQPPSDDPLQDIPLAEKLLNAADDKAALLNAQDSEGWTPLSLAVDKGHQQLVTWLITHGANRTLGLTAAAGGQSPLMLALRLKPEDLPDFTHWQWTNKFPDVKAREEEVQRLLAERKAFMIRRANILRTLLYLPVIQHTTPTPSAPQSKRGRKGAKAKGRGKAAEADEKTDPMDVDPSPLSPPSAADVAGLAAVDAEEESLFFYAARSLCPFSDTALILSSPLAHNNPALTSTLNRIPHPDTGGGPVLAEVLRQTPSLLRVLRPTYQPPQDAGEQEREKLIPEPTHHLHAHLQLVALLLSHGADPRLQWKSRLPKSDDPKVLRDAKRKQEAKSQLMLALDAPAALVLPLFSLLVEAGAPLEGRAAPSRSTLLHLLVGRVRGMDLLPFLQLLASKAAAPEVAAALQSQAAEVDRDGLTPTLLLWKTALPLPARSPSSADGTGAGVASSPPVGDRPPKPMCQYGASCYRKNPAHLADFLHPGDPQPTAPPAPLPNAPTSSRPTDTLLPTLSREGFMSGTSQAPSLMSGLFRLPTLPSASSLIPSLLGFISHSHTHSSPPPSTGTGSSATDKYFDVDDNVEPVDEAVSPLPLYSQAATFRYTAEGALAVAAAFSTLPLGSHINDRVALSDAAVIEERKARKAEVRLAAMRTAEKAGAVHDPLDSLLEKRKKGHTQAELHCTPLHLAVRAGDVEGVTWLLGNGADVLSLDWFDRTPLHLAALQSSDTAIPSLLLASRASEQLQRGDAMGVTPLAMAIAYSASHSNDERRGFVEAFALESLLLGYKGLVDINARDRMGRTPLHCIFCPLYEKHPLGSRQPDPIELLSDFVAATSTGASSSSASTALMLDEKDVYGRTPLLYCSELGAQICLKYLLARGCDVKTIDAEGNGAFQLALLNKHLGYCVDLVDTGVDIVRPIADYKSPVDGRPLLRPTFEFVLRADWSGLAYLMQDAGIPLTTAIRDALATDRFHLVATLLKKSSAQAVQQVDGVTGMNVLHVLADYTGGSGVSGSGVHFQEVWCMKIVELLVSRGMDAAAFASARTVKGQLPLHLAARRGHCKLMEFLLSAVPRQEGVHRDDSANVNELDFYSYSPLHHAVEGRHLKAVNLLCQRGATLDWPYMDFAQLFTAYNQRRSAHSTHTPTKGKPHHVEPLPADLCRNPPVVQAALDSDYTLLELLLRYAANPNQAGKGGLTPLMLAVQRNDPRLACLAMHGNAGIPAKRGAELPYVVQLMPKPRFTPADINAQDVDGNTALHHLIIPQGQYQPSFENTALLKDLVTWSALTLSDEARKANIPPRWQTTNAKGHTAVYYAAQQQSGAVLKALEQLKVKRPAAEVDRARADLQQHLDDEERQRGPPAYTQHPALDVDKDCTALRQWLEARRKLDTGAAVDEEVEVDEPKLASTYKVYVDRSDSTHPVTYDVMLTFTDTSGRHNRFGSHSFYVMQLLYNAPQDLFLLWNRWGRIGTRGEYQQTPQTSQEAAVKEFKSIFKSKTGNAWEARAEEQFEVKVGKYTINRAKRGKGKEGKEGKEGEEDAAVIPLHRLMEQYHGVLPHSSIPAPLQTLIALICDVSSLQAMARKLGVETSIAAPLGDLTDEQVTEARSILSQVAGKLEAFTAVQGELGKVQVKLSQLQQSAFQGGFGAFNPLQQSAFQAAFTGLNPSARRPSPPRRISGRMQRRRRRKRGPPYRRSALV